MYNDLSLTKQDLNGILDVGDILDSITDAPLKTTQYEVVKALLKTFHAESISFFLRDKETLSLRNDQTVILNLGWDFTNQYIDYYHRIDPFLKIANSMTCRDTDLMPYSAMQKLEIYNDFQRPQGIRHTLCLILQNGSNQLGLIGINRHYSNRASFSSKDLIKARVIAKMLAFGIWQRQNYEMHWNDNKVSKELTRYFSSGNFFLNRNLRDTSWNSRIFKEVYPCSKSLKLACDSSSKSQRGRLTPREYEIMQLLVLGLTNNEISQKLGIGLPTVATHVRHIYEKVGANRHTLLYKLFLA